MCRKLCAAELAVGRYGLWDYGVYDSNSNGDTLTYAVR